MNSTFVELCKKGNLEEIKQFYCNNPTIDISADNEWAFELSCQYGHLEVAKWLLEIKPTINISADNEDAFRYACEKGKLKVANLLLQHKPKNYYIFAIKNKRQKHRIYTKKQQIAKLS